MVISEDVITSPYYRCDLNICGISYVSLCLSSDTCNITTYHGLVTAVQCSVTVRGYFLHALVFRGMPALGPFLYPGLPALGPFLDQGLSPRYNK